MGIIRKGANRTGDHLLNTAPSGKKLPTGRAARRLRERTEGKTDMGRDELFAQRIGALKSGQQKYDVSEFFKERK